MAAYAALVSLINNIEQIKIHPRVSTLFDVNQLESLLERVDSLLVIIESYNSSGGSKDEAEELERQIASAAHAAEDVIESHIVDQILPEVMMIQSRVVDQPVADSTDAIIQSPIEDQIVARLNIQLMMLDLWVFIQAMDSIREKVMKVEEERGYKVELPPQSSTVAASSRTPSAGKINMVGFDGYSTQLLLKLTGHQPDRQIIPIVGMGGLGKTTLARNAYDSLSVVQHFTVRAWVVISQTYILRDILCEILSCLGESKHGMDRKAENELCQMLHKTLFNRRYLIVLDDMWSMEAWDRIKFFFPNNCNGSRILVTTRILDIANHFDSIAFELNCLDVVHSWKLFCEKVFPNEDCPAELEEIGKEIVKKCRGLPLAIVVIGGLLGNSSRTKDHWENVAKDISSTLNMAEDNRCLKLLSLSYSHLPARLKPCFIYLGIFPEDDAIRISRLIKLWVAEGFIKPNKDQSLEEVAESYIKDLLDRNLISVHTLRWNGNVKTFRIHDLLRDLCIRVAEKENFLCMASELDTPLEMDWQRRVIIHASTSRDTYKYNTQVLDTLRSKSLARSLMLKQGRRVHVKSRLLRVLVEAYSEPRDIIYQQVNLRFLDQEEGFRSSENPYSYHLPSSISLLWNVQTLIITRRTIHILHAPSDIWKMPQLRHLITYFVHLPEPLLSDGIVLHNLQTLKTVEDFRFSRKACKRMPNVKKLHVIYSQFTWLSSNFAFFDKLETLNYYLGQDARRDNLLSVSFKFPSSLKKLVVEEVPLQWEDLGAMGSLPNLEALILKTSVRGDNWDPVEGEFLRLRFLQIVDSDLICWNADDTHFPALENLALESLYFLNEIPSGVGDIQTLEQISLTSCNDSCALSALKILEEQQDFGNEGLQVKVRLASESGVKEFMELVEAEGLTGLKFQIDADQRN